MPHDKKGNEVQQGDRVVLYGTVKEVYPGADACNVEVQADPVEGEFAPVVVCNSKFFQLARTLRVNRLR